MCEIDSNYVDMKLWKIRKDNEMTQAYQELLARVKTGGVCNPKKHILDNKKSEEFKREIRK